jgi:hypothetical protein
LLLPFSPRVNVTDECCLDGTGFNMIFRPRPGFTDISEDNDLELNLTIETMQFIDSRVLANIPNKGFGNQPSTDLTGCNEALQTSP